MRYLIVTLAGLAVATTAAAQYPNQPFPGSGAGQYGYGQQNGFGQQYGSGSQYGNQNNSMPNIYNPQNQPLSPYLNLLRGGNQGVNYFYGVRPGTTGGTGLGLGAPFTAAGGNRMLFFPQLASAPDPLQPREAADDRVLPPAGHT